MRKVPENFFWNLKKNQKKKVLEIVNQGVYYIFSFALLGFFYAAGKFSYSNTNNSLRERIPPFSVTYLEQKPAPVLNRSFMASQPFAMLDSYPVKWHITVTFKDEECRGAISNIAKPLGESSGLGIIEPTRSLSDSPDALEPPLFTGKNNASVGIRNPTETSFSPRSFPALTHSPDALEPPLFRGKNNPSVGPTETFFSPRSRPSSPDALNFPLFTNHLKIQNLDLRL
jgi:hypothetical protein